MNRLPSELRRLFVPRQGHALPGAEPDAPDLIDPAGQVRAMVLGLTGPADWQAVSRVWRGVQADLDLPAPAIAVAGEAGYQLWFSLADAEPAARALTFLEALRLRYLSDIEPQRIRLLPTPDATSGLRFRHAGLVPAPLASGGPWSAFVAPDLAPMFSDEPWLDLPPSPEGQAELLSRLASIPRTDVLRALSQMASALPTAAPTAENAGPGTLPSTSHTQTTDPRRFLMGVMNDERVDLALRIDAAKALLRHGAPDVEGDR